MPKQEDLKRLIRARMKKTGESYTTARHQVLNQESVTPSVEKFAELAGMGDEAVQAKTGRTWEQWVDALDYRDAISMTHREIAQMVHERFEIPAWWAQTVAVGYERIRGLREIGQRRTTGKFDAHKSKTFPVPASKLYGAWSVKRTRERWLPEVEMKVRTAIRDKSMRITWPDGSSVHAYFTDKGSQKSSVAVQHVGLPSKEDLAPRKKYWADRLAALGEVL